jgi:hypothetical protein
VISSFFPVFSSYALNISLNDWIEGLSLVRHYYLHAEIPQVGGYLVVPGDSEATVLQLFRRKARQDV